MKCADILLVEDNPGDVALVREGLRELEHRLEVAESGERALEFLRARSAAPERSMPDVVLLDLNLPGLTGLEVLCRIRSDPDTAALPVVVMTSSDARKDIVESYRLHANCYVTKPSSLDEYMRVMRRLGEFWFSVAKLPTD